MHYAMAMRRGDCACLVPAWFALMAVINRICVCVNYLSYFGWSVGAWGLEYCTTEDYVQNMRMCVWACAPVCYWYSVSCCVCIGDRGLDVVHSTQMVTLTRGAIRSVTASEKGIHGIYTSGVAVFKSVPIFGLASSIKLLVNNANGTWIYHCLLVF